MNCDAFGHSRNQRRGRRRRRPCVVSDECVVPVPEDSILTIESTFYLFSHIFLVESYPSVGDDDGQCPFIAEHCSSACVGDQGRRLLLDVAPWHITSHSMSSLSVVGNCICCVGGWYLVGE